MKTLTFVTLSFFVILAVNRGHTQSFPNSPYSYYGVGDIVPRGFGQQLMVGNTGIADRNSLTINNLNPASYSDITIPYTFIAEMGFNFSSIYREDQNTSGNQLNMQLPYLSIAFRTGNQSGASLGLRQFSNVDYNILGIGTFTGLQEEYSVNYLGEGGINEFYFGWAKSPMKNFSFGFHGSFLFGQINESQIIRPFRANSLLNIEDEQFVSGLKIELGLQYMIKLKNSNLILGLTASPSSDLNEQRDLTITNQISRQLPVMLIDESVDEQLDYSVPVTTGVGLAWNSGFYKVTTDYSSQLWGNTRIEGSRFQTRNSHRFSVGLQKLPNYSEDSFWSIINWGIGSYYDQSYRVIEGDPLNTLGFTAGMSYPVGRNKGIIRFIIENATRGGNVDNYFTERMTRFTLSVSIIEFWFRKSVYD